MSFVSELAPVPESAFPCPPLRRRIRAGEGVRGTWRGGDGLGGEQGAYGPAARGDRPGAAAVTRSRAPLFRGEVRASAVPGIPTRPPGAPGRARCGNNFLLPRPRAQELRGEVLGRSFAILEPDDDTAAHGRAVPSRALSRGRDQPGSRVRTLVRVTRRPQLLFLPAPQERLSGFWRLGTPTRGRCARTPSPCLGMPSLGARWTWLSPDARDRGPRERRPPGPHPSVSLCLSPRPPPQPALAF
ncbi:uncharacterized protein [Physeter macrocephalus]|uniref:Uncharacterized protein n=1 Tax=Physeter macrocephalus TaxID=9755 RepID=A0A455BRK7_PHYMC|nr:uncharacterized protein LOC114486450 [Physeter catodon]|eukprot:XP_028346516.1 uncharacterized protein LOC114486450 [Physeter catodon]